MKRVGRWSLVGVALAGVVLAFSVAPGGATPPSGLTNVVLARGTQVTNGTIPSIRDGHCSCGRAGLWHSHQRDHYVKQGTRTVKAVGANAWSKRAAPGCVGARAEWIRSLTPARGRHQYGHVPACTAGREQRELTSGSACPGLDGLTACT
jgi:hypothetical protein